MTNDSSNSPKSLSAIIADHRALVILRALEQASYRLNEAVLADYLRLVALSCSHQHLRSEVETLERRGLVTVSYERSLLVLSLTTRGQEAAQGAISVEGVLKPAPDCPY